MTPLKPQRSRREQLSMITEGSQMSEEDAPNAEENEIQTEYNHLYRPAPSRLALFCTTLNGTRMA